MLTRVALTVKICPSHTAVIPTFIVILRVWLPGYPDRHCRPALTTFSRQRYLIVAITILHVWLLTEPRRISTNAMADTKTKWVVILHARNDRWPTHFLFVDGRRVVVVRGDDWARGVGNRIFDFRFFRQSFVLWYLHIVQIICLTTPPPQHGSV